MTEISTPNTDRILREHEEWQKRYTGLPINFIEEIENAKIKELQSIVRELEDINNSHNAMADHIAKMNDFIESIAATGKKILLVAGVLGVVLFFIQFT